MTTSFKFELRQGNIVVGKWKQGRYRVERLLGEGANGKVYLVQRDRDWFALKVGMDAVDLQSEINVLKSLAGQNEQGKEPFLFDVDDLYGTDGREYSFYTMRYVRGTTLASYLKEQGSEWFPLVGLNLLGKLAKLHRTGWVFGDLKVENVLVADYGHVELVDYGGVTATGKSIRQFTEIYDRGFWNSGSRSADPKYDLFSFSVLCIQLHEPKKLHTLSKELLPQNRSISDLMVIAEGCTALRPIIPWLKKALIGDFANATEGAESWRLMMHRREVRGSASTPGWLKGFMATSGLLLAISIFWLLRHVF
ncbi:serine/threonine protein kinase [Paenibacillus sp. GSMTC-2017]|uniref:protein kinase domain-containing protein n=1 Tax=Paenibacillus sp. GSMTC-2017 TaxID=2794350 RepID=UPI0018D75BF4|nr:serine/threonine protein kinase [Paenibacillus sp. GSMTC-2017]